MFFFFFQAEDGIRDKLVTGVQTCALPISFPRALKEDGSPAAPLPVTWKSRREDIASIEANGVVVARASGQGTVQVTAPGGLTATAPVVVQQTEVAILEQSPIALSPGDVDTLHVVVPAQGNRLVSPLSVQWSSGDATVARMSLTGVVMAVAPGRTTGAGPGGAARSGGPCGCRRRFWGWGRVGSAWL